MSWRVTKGEFLGLLLAVVLFGTALHWPLLSQTRSDSVATSQLPNATHLLPPPNWLLPVDDAYIFIRFAQQLARGRLYQWTDDQYSSGSTSLLFPWLLVPGQWLFDDLAGWSRWSVAVGGLTTWLLAVFGCQLLAMAGLHRPWPVAGGLALILSGAITFVSLAGMDSAFGASALLLACLCYSRLAGFERSKREHTWQQVRAFLLLLAALPFVRPDFLPFVGVMIFVLLRKPLLGTPRWWLTLVPIPTLVWLIFNFVATGNISPAGVLAKSNFSSPFLAFGEGVTLVWLTLTKGIVPLYLGAQPHILPPPIGILAALTGLVVFARTLRISRPPLSFSAESRRVLRVLEPVALAWAINALSSSCSGYLVWQFYRHHHPGLACAWILAVGGVFVGTKELFDRFEQLRPKVRSGLRHALILTLPFLLLTQLSSWSFKYFRAAVFFYQDNGVVGEWIDRHLADDVILIHDAGLLALAHDGPAIDSIGLGTPQLALAFRDGEGAVIESLRRLPLQPALAAGKVRLLNVSTLLQKPIFIAPSSQYSDEPMIVAPVRSELFASAADDSRPESLLDFAYLPSEQRFEVEWSPRPHQPSSFALALMAVSGKQEIHGCRALHGHLEIHTPPSIRMATLRWATQPGPTGRLGVSFRSRDSSRESPIREFVLDGGSKSWSQLALDLPTAARAVVFKNLGQNLLCLESITFRPSSALIDHDSIQRESADSRSSR